ncbi:hypothetical protein D3C75_1038120 [compost metagenome]
MQRRHAVHQNPATDQEHRRGTDHRQALHHVRRRTQDAVAQHLCRTRRLLGQPQPQVIEFDDTGNQAIHADGHDNGDAREHDDLLTQRRSGNGAQGDCNDLCRENEVGANRALDLGLLEGHQIDVRVRYRFD